MKASLDENFDVRAELRTLHDELENRLKCYEVADNEGKNELNRQIRQIKCDILRNSKKTGAAKPLIKQKQAQ